MKLDMSKYPWMPLYTKDILTSCSEMTNEEFGVYCRLLFDEWNNGSLNSKPDRLPIKLPDEESLAIVMAKFEKGADGRLRNHRLESIRDEFVVAKEAQSEGGKKGAKKRWGTPTHKEAIGQPILQVNANHNQSHIHKDNQKDIKKKSATKVAYTTDFETFWKAYPIKKGKQKAFDSWEKYNPPLDKCLDTIENFKNSGEWDDSQYIKHPATWLNQGCWDDELPKPVKDERPF